MALGACDRDEDVGRGLRRIATRVSMRRRSHAVAVSPGATVVSGARTNRVWPRPASPTASLPYASSSPAFRHVCYPISDRRAALQLATPHQSRRLPSAPAG